MCGTPSERQPEPPAPSSAVMGSLALNVPSARSETLGGSGHRPDMEAMQDEPMANDRRILRGLLGELRAESAVLARPVACEGAAMRDDRSVEVGVAYLEIALRLRKLAPWMVEDYLGPSDLAAAVDAAPSEGAVELAERVRAVRQTLDGAGLDENRQAWLDAQLAALDTVLAVLAGERFGYRELVERCHGVSPMFVPESVFAAAHAQLAEVLPGSGDVRTRYQRWAVGQQVQPERLLAGLHALSEELRRRPMSCRAARRGAGHLRARTRSAVGRLRRVSRRPAHRRPYQHRPSDHLNVSARAGSYKASPDITRTRSARTNR